MTWIPTTTTTPNITITTPNHPGIYVQPNPGQNLVLCSNCSMWWTAARTFQALSYDKRRTYTYCSQFCCDEHYKAQYAEAILRASPNHVHMDGRPKRNPEPLPTPTPAVIALSAFGNVPVRAIRAFHELHVTELDEVRALVKDEPPGLLQAKGVGRGTVEKVRALLEEMDTVRKMLGLD